MIIRYIPVAYILVSHYLLFAVYLIGVLYKAIVIDLLRFHEFKYVY